MPGFAEEFGPPDEGVFSEDAFSENSEDTLGEDDPTGRESSGDEEGSGSSQEQTFFDASKVPVELRPTFRTMQANLTRKEQALAERSRELSALEHKASILDALADNHEFANLLREYQARINGQSSGGGQPVADESSLDPQVRQEIEKVVRGVLGPTVGPILGRLGSMEDQARISAEKQQFVAAHPDYMDYAEGMQQAWEREGGDLSFEAAYKLAKFDRIVAAKGNQQRRENTRQAGVEGRAPARRTVPKQKPIANFGDAVEAALAQMELDPKEVGWRRGM